MAISTWAQTNFNAGEWSPFAQGRADHDRYKNALAECTNFVPTQLGALTRRPGTRYVASAKNSELPRLQEFIFNQDQAYVLEFGTEYVRFYVNNGQLLDSGSPYEVATPYTLAEVWTLDFKQSGDVLYIACPTQAPRKLVRAGATSWTLEVVDFLDGPYLSLNVSSTSLTPSATTGTTNVVATDTDGINGGAGFRATDVGRALRIKCSGVWLAGTIASVTSTTGITWTIEDPTGSRVQATATAKAYVSSGGVYSIAVLDGGGGYGVTPPSVTISGGSGATAYATLTAGVVTSITVQNIGSGYAASTVTVTLTAPEDIDPSTTLNWRLGLWNDTDGYPSCVAFYQSRLCWAGAGGQPDRVDGSNTGDYENMAPTELDGTVIDSNAFSFALGQGSVDQINWLEGDEQGLLMGTSEGLWAMTPTGVQQALTATNVYIRKIANLGSKAMKAARLGRSIMFVQRTGRKLWELFYEYTYNTFNPSDLSLAASHMLESGMKQMAVQMVPQQIVWGVREDGQVVAMTFDRNEKTLGWHQHTVGGTDTSVGSVCVIPSPDDSHSQLWWSVSRTINGATVYYIERMAEFWNTETELEDAVFLDSSASYTGTGVTTISGLTWLAGETVGVLLNGAKFPDQTVSTTGTISLGATGTRYSTITVQVGLKYTSRARTMRIESGGQDGPAQGKLKRIFSVLFRFVQTLGLKLGTDNPNESAYELTFRSPSDTMDAPPALYTGDRREAYEGAWDSNGQLYFEVSDPVPCNITMLTAHLVTEDGR